MTDQKIEGLSISIVKAVELARQLSTQAQPGGKGKDAKVNLQRLVDGLQLTRDALENKFNIERNKTILSTAALSSIEEILAGFDAVFRRVEEVVENSRDDRPTKGKDLEESKANALLVQLDRLKSKVLMMSEVISYAALIRRGECELVRQRQESNIRALLDGETETKEAPEALTATDAVQPGAAVKQASDLGRTTERDQPSQSPAKEASQRTMNEVTSVFQSFRFNGQNNEIAQDTTSPGPPTNPSDSTMWVTKKRKETDPIIVGIDFGATSSAVAFSPANSTKQEPTVLDRWPESLRRSRDGVPREQQIQSTVYYNHALEVIGWGEEKHDIVYEVGHPYMERNGLSPFCTLRPGIGTYLVGPALFCSVKPGVQPVSHFKLGLSAPEDSEIFIPTSLGKSAADVTADYLWHLRQSACSQIEGQLGTESGKVQRSFSYVMTVPAFWDEKAQDELRKAAKVAGFWIHSDEELILVPGPEAAMLYADFIDPSVFHVGDKILVADCGGQLVESVTYEVKSKEPLRVEKCTGISVASCGSDEVTRRFLGIVESKLKKAGLKLRGSRLYAKSRYQFDRYIKHEFGKPDIQHLPGTPRGFWALDLGIELEDLEADIEEGYMMFSKEEIHSCFDQVIDRAVDLIENQITAVGAQNKKLQGCLLVGGFNKCAYYTQKIQSRVAAHGLKIIQPEPCLAFVKGAVLAGCRDVHKVRQPGRDIEGRKVRDLVMKWTTLSQEQIMAL